MQFIMVVIFMNTFFRIYPVGITDDLSQPGDVGFVYLIKH